MQWIERHVRHRVRMTLQPLQIRPRSRANVEQIRHSVFGSTGEEPEARAQTRAYGLDAVLMTGETRDATASAEVPQSDNAWELRGKTLGRNVMRHQKL